MRNEVLNFYKQTSLYTDLGFYKDFMKSLTDDVDELCVLQRKQIIHPFAFKDLDIRKRKNCFWGDMRKVPITRFNYEDDLFPTAGSMICELLRRDKEYKTTRKAEDKINITCRGQAILLAATLKAKGVPARVRSGFASYISDDESNHDHWITEYYDNEKWVLVDADMHLTENISFNLNDIPRNKFIFGAEAYLGIRKGIYKPKDIYYASVPPILGLKAALRGLFYDFHSLMNNEITFLHLPKYVLNKNFNLSDEEYKELDELATLMLDPDSNFNKLLEIYNHNTKFTILAGQLNY